MPLGRVFALSNAYRVITKAVVGYGTSVMFWTDLWGSEKLEQRYPRLFCFALDKEQSVSQFMASGDRTENFYMPLSVEAYDEFLLLEIDLQEVTLSGQDSDRWNCILAEGVFKPSLVYREHIANHVPSCWIWKSKCQSKHKFFA